MSDPYRDFSSREEAEAFANQSWDDLGNPGNRKGRVGGSITENEDGTYRITWGSDTYSRLENAKGNEYSAEGLHDVDADLAGTPLGWLFGSNSRYDDAVRRREQARQDALFAELTGSQPTEDDLTVQYGTEGRRDEWGDLLGGESEVRQGSSGIDAQYGALRALQNIVDAGGYTRADQMQRNAAAAANAQRLQGANRAAIQQAQARGMGGGGAELGARLMGSQAYSQGQHMADAQIQSEAMQRALQAMQGVGQIGSSIDANEARRQAMLDSFNQRNADWRRGREERNTRWRNQSAESEANARQQTYENRERAAALQTNQYSSSESGRRQDAARRDQQNQDTLAGLGTLISELAG